VNQNDAAVIFLSVRETVRDFDEIRYVERHQHAALTRGRAEQIVIVELLQRGTA